MYYTFMHKIRLKGKKQETNRQKMIMMIKKNRRTQDSNLQNIYQVD